MLIWERSRDHKRVGRQYEFVSRKQQRCFKVAVKKVKKLWFFFYFFILQYPVYLDIYLCVMPSFKCFEYINITIVSFTHVPSDIETYIFDFTYLYTRIILHIKLFSDDDI